MRIAIFVDGNNVFYACQHLNFSIDYMKLTSWLGSKYEGSSIILRRFYTGIPKEISDRQKDFFDIIGENGIGYTLITRDLKKIINNDVVIGHKGDMDARIGYDMSEFKNAYDILVYLGGDSDFAEIFKSLAREGKRILIISTKDTVASEIMQLTNPKQTNVEFADLEDISNEVGRGKIRVRI